MAYEWLPSHTPSAAELRACAELDDPMHRAAFDLGLGKGQRFFVPLRQTYPEILDAPEHYGRGVLMFMQGDAGDDALLPILSVPPASGGVESHQKTASTLRKTDPRLREFVYWSFHLWGTTANNYMIFANTSFYGGNTFDEPRKARIAERLHGLLPHLDHLVLIHGTGELPELRSRPAA